MFARLLKDCGDETAGLKLALEYLDGVNQVIPKLSGERRQAQIRNLQSVVMFIEPQGNWIEVKKKANDILQNHEQNL